MSARRMPDDGEIELTPAQAGWIDPIYASYRDDARRDPACDGCAVFGLCIAHSTTEESSQP